MKKCVKRGLAVMLALCMFGAFSPTAANAVSPLYSETLNYSSMTFWLAETAGVHSGTVIRDGVLALADGETKGEYVSESVRLGAFKILLASWNARTNGGKISVSVRFETAPEKWTRWYSWGIWSSTPGASESGNDSDAYAAMNIDTLEVKSTAVQTGNVSIRVKLEEYGGGRPTVSSVTLAAPQMEKRREAPEYPAYFLNDVPMRSQHAPENGADGGSMCSPTTAAMAVEYMGTRIPTLTAAKIAYDNGAEIYGNWSFAAAFAGEQGYTAYVDLYDADMIKYALSRGCAVGCSTKLTSSGHLVLIVGYDEARGEYIVNDPNVPSGSVKRTSYKYSYFNERWLKKGWNGLGVVYVFQKTKTLPLPFGRGDADGDGETDNLDAALILGSDAGVSELDARQRSAADLNSDGEADNLDASLVLQYDAGITDKP